MPRDLNPEQWAGLHSALNTPGQSGRSKPAKNPSAAQKQSRKTQEKGNTMRNDKGPRDPSASTGTGEIPTIVEKPVITGEIPIVGIDRAAKKLEAQIPGLETDAKAKAHDKGHLQAERGFMPQHSKKGQPQPRWNLPRRQG